jgi:hypothetical protein
VAGTPMAEAAGVGAMRDPSFLLQLYRRMVTIRRTEGTLVRLFAEGRRRDSSTPTPARRRPQSACARHWAGTTTSPAPIVATAISSPKVGISTASRPRYSAGAQATAAEKGVRRWTISPGLSRGT